jgi:AGZA family xanthine/uracil permease-like MFS transporter
MQQSVLRREILAGLTTFLTIVYIIFVNPAILHEAGMDQGSVFTATCLVTAFTTALTGLYAKTPIAMAPGMALNIYFAYGVVLGAGIDWPHALGMVFFAGFLFFILSLTPLRRLLIEAIPHNLQIAILIGISLLIALIALRSNGWIVSDPHTLMRLGRICDVPHALFFVGFLLILGLDYFKVPGAILLGIIAVTLMSFLLGLSSWHGLVAMPPSILPTAFQFDFSGFFSIQSMQATFTFFLIAIFDATGTLIGLLSQPVFKNDNQTARLSHSLTVDAAGSMLAGMLGSSSTSPFIESAAGIEAGGRTGMTALVVAGCFLLMPFFYPLAQMIPIYAVGPALLYVACCMMKHITELKLNDITEVAPCMLTIMMTPFTTSIADGLGAGIIVYTFLKFFTGQRPNGMVISLSVVFILFFLMNG